MRGRWVTSLHTLNFGCWDHVSNQPGSWAGIWGLGMYYIQSLHLFSGYALLFSLEMRALTCPVLPDVWEMLISIKVITLKIYHKQISRYTAWVSSCSCLNRNIKEADGLCKTECFETKRLIFFSVTFHIYFYQNYKVWNCIKRKMTIDNTLIPAIALLIFQGVFF